jgi:zinc metalloprotease ZmpB
MAFQLSPNVHVERDGQGVVRHLAHLQAPYTLPAGLAAPSPQALAGQYLRDVAQLYGIDQGCLKDLSRQMGSSLTQEGTLLQFAEQKSVMETTVVAYAQTHFGLPIWGAGVSVLMNAHPPRVTSSLSTFEHDVQIDFVDPANFKVVPGQLNPELLARLLGQQDAKIRINGTKLRIYRYDPVERYDPDASADRQPEPIARAPRETPMQAHAPILQLPDVAESIRAGQHYVVVEVLFTKAVDGWEELNWRCFIEPVSASVLYLRAFVAAATGAVYERDPLTATGDLMITAGSAAGTLDALRSIVTLPGLTPPAPGENQALRGEFVQLVNISDPAVAAPTEALPGTFSYSVPTDDFAAVNAYYHSDSVFRLVQSMGFNMATYFDGTSFPVRVDHRATIGGGCANGNCVNAQAPGNTTGTGSDGFRYALAATSQPVGIACDLRVVLHEFSHALLWDSVHSPNFGFAHSAGDSLAAILCDAGSQAPDRFQTFPWILPDRRHDRAVASGLGWGGSNDVGGYSSEQILSTTMFRVYRSLGGDSADLNLQKYAARWTAYLIIRAIGSLATSPITPTPNASVFATTLMNADIGTTLFEGIGGGGVHKVIRWGFEKQGLYQPAGAPTPVITEGAPPAVDVYIDDGRAGEYTFLANHWSTTDIWNRLAADSGLTHETPVVGVTNYVYVRIKNRGTQSANNVVVKGYHCHPSTGLRWPDDWQAMTTAQVSVPGALASGDSTVVGPFEWTPEVVGHECLLAAVSATADLANTETVAGPMPEWWLVRNDNNIAQRNVAPVPGGGGGLSLAAAFKGRKFTARNPFDKAVQVKLDVVMPAFLRERQYELQFMNAGGAAFSLGARMDREIVMSLKQGREFTAADVEASKDAVIEVRAYVDEILTGGMSYQIDPQMKTPALETPQAAPPAGECDGNAKQFLGCLNLSESEVKKVTIRKVTVDIVMKDDCGC